MTTTTIDWHSVHRRMKLAIEMLTTRHIYDGHKLDQALANAALADCRGEKIDGLVQFSGQTGVPLDWLMLGDTGALVCAVVAASYSGQEGAAVESTMVDGQYSV